jgi:hypothetical protein
VAKFALAQAMKAQRGLGARWGWVVAMPQQLCSQESPSTHCIGGWVGPRGGVDRCGKSGTHRGSIPRPSSPQ